MDSINKRFKSIRLALGLNQTDFGKKLGLEQGSVGDVERGRDGVSVSKAVKKLLFMVYHVNTHWLETGEGDMFIKPRAVFSEQDDNNNKSSHVVNDPDIGYSKQRSLYKSDHTLTYLPMSAMAGFLSVVKDMSPDIQQQFEQVKLPDYNHCDTVIEIDGDSMYPTFSSKDQVICKRKESMRYIETGKPYVINVDGEFVIKRIFDHEQPEKIILRSDNPYYPDQIIEREWIKAIFKIHGVISNNTGERKIIKQTDI